MIGFSKEDQGANSPGGKGKMSERRTKRLNSKQKGSRGEREFIDFCKALMGLKREAGDKRNWQFISGGGASNPDVDIRLLPSVHHEVKNCDEFDIPEWLRQLTKDCPVNRIPCLAVKLPQHLRKTRSAKWWCFVPNAQLYRFCEEWLVALQGQVCGSVDPFPVPFDAQTFHFSGYLSKKHTPGQYVLRDGWTGFDMHDLHTLAAAWVGGEVTF